MSLWSELNPQAELKQRGLVFKSGTAHYYVGDNREVLRSLPANSHHCCVTSPPYFNLRDYGTGEWVGGEADCGHIERFSPQRDRMDSEHSKARGTEAWTVASQTFQYKDVCLKCGAVRTDKQIGREQTLDEYVNNLVEVMREVRRVLRDDGVLWLNLGDSYNSGGGYTPSSPSNLAGSLQSRHAHATREVMRNLRKSRPGTKRADGVVDPNSPRNRNGVSVVQEGLKHKDLLMVPAQVALALRADGWYLRKDIIWHKRNVMPESSTDRPTSSHEHVFMLTKQPTYFYDDVAVATRSGSAGSIHANKKDNVRAVAAGISRGASGNEKAGAAFRVNDTAQLRDVWTIGTAGEGSGEHAAVFPEELVRTCVKAASSEQGCCPTCGAPLRRTERQIGGARRLLVPDAIWDWQPACSHEVVEPIPCWVLDPFAGIGTTGLTAGKLGRHSTLIELSPKWAEAGRKRLEADDVPVKIMPRKRRSLE